MGNTAISLLSLSLLLADNVLAAAPEELKNWFNDPFFQLRQGVSACPVPLGPLMTEAQRRAESHYRVERGTSCWMEGKCAQANAYLYDAPLGEAVRQRFADPGEFGDTSLWITVQKALRHGAGLYFKPGTEPAD